MKYSRKLMNGIKFSKFITAAEDITMKIRVKFAINIAK